jgi:hypothetical protein
MHVSINFKSPNNISKWQIGFNSAFKGLREEGDSEEDAVETVYPTRDGVRQENCLVRST